ncbi:hypothetical protein N9W31_05390 [Litoricolaceae bacterium]|nr:hypothetical protein [Litorivicinaceae bacterium]
MIENTPTYQGRWNKKGSALLIAVVLAAATSFMIARLTEVSVDATNRKISKGTESKAILQSREIAEIASYAVRFSGGIPDTWRDLQEMIDSEPVLTTSSNEDLINNCLRRNGSLSEPINWSSVTLNPKVGELSQGKPKRDLNNFRAIPFPGAGIGIVGEHDIPSGNDAGYRKTLTAFGCGQSNQQLASTAIRMVKYRGQLITAEFREE